MKAALSKAAFLAGAAVLLSGPALAGKANDTLVWSTSQAIASPDPYYNQLRERIIINRNVCDGLTFANPDTRKIEPQLAKSWEQVNPTTLEFTLREDVKFHDGRPLTADDVVYTYNWISNPENGIVNASEVSWVKGAEKLGPYKVRIMMKEPRPTVLENISDNVPILPNGHYDKATTGQGGRKNYGAVPLVCTGPYKVVSYVPGESVDTTRNDLFYEGTSKTKPHIKNMRFRTIPDPETQIAELLTGGVDAIWIASKDRAELLEKMGRVQVKAISILRMDFIQFETLGRTGKNPFQDVRVRRAVAHAINRPAIAANLVGKVSKVIHSQCSPTQFGCTQDVPHYDYNPDRAKALLAEAGYKDGFETDFYGYLNRETTEAIISDLRKVGIRTRLKFMQFQALLPMQRSGEAQFSHLSWASLGLNDASANTSHYFRGRSDDQARDKEVMDWLAIADSSLDRKVREENYKKALTKIADQAYTVPLWTYVRYYGLSPDLDFEPHFDDIARFWNAKWK